MSGATLTKFWLLILAQQSPDWALSWTAPAECTQVEAVSRAVEQRLGHPVFGAPARYRIDGKVEKLGPGYHAQLTLQDSGGTVLGTREVSSTEAACASLDARVTLVLALMISPSQGAAPISAPPAAAPPLLPAAPAPGPLLRVDEQVQVHLDSDDPRTQLIRLVDSPGASYVATTVVCDAPCDKPVKASARLFIGGEGVLASDEFSVQGMSAATVQVKTGSLPRRMGGILSMTLGTSMVAGGVLLLLIGLAGSSSSTLATATAGAVLSGTGGAGLVFGLLLVQGTGTTVTVTPTF